MKHQQAVISLILIVLGACSSPKARFEGQNNEDASSELGIESNQDKNQRSQSQPSKNPILGTWKLIPGQKGGEYWPKPCREIRFEKRASYCGDTGAPSSYDVQGNQVTVYDNNFEQIYRFPDPDTMTVNVAGVGTLKFNRVN